MMDDLQQLYVRLRKYMFNLLAIFVLGWGFTDYKAIFLGLILGTSVGFFNLRFLMKRTKRFGEAVVEGRKARSLGMVTRMAAAVVGIAIVLWFPDMFHLISFVIGLMLCYVVIMIDFFVQAFRSRK